MNKNEKFVIVINRELGSGGHTIGRLLAEKLGVNYHDKAVISGLEEDFNLTKEEIERLKGTKNDWWDIICRFMQIGPGMSGELGITYKPDGSGVLTADDIFAAETEILKNLGSGESCVIAGRLGFHVFREHPNHMSIFIQASMPFRIKRLMSKQNMTEEEARTVIEKIDEMRETYVKKYAKTSRYDTRNYDLVITADGKKEEEIAEYILQFLE
jgi:cytidylate kinase